MKKTFHLNDGSDDASKDVNREIELHLIILLHWASEPVIITNRLTQL